MKIAIRGGHNPGVPGASDLLDEVIEDRKYYKVIMDYLKTAGHEILDVTPERTTTSIEDLSYGVNRANLFGADLFVSCHLNAGGGKGCEVWYLGIKGKEYANTVSNGMAKLGFNNRGAKYDVRGLFELHHTNMPAIIIEPLFLDSKSDVDLYKKVGIEALAKSVAEAIHGNSINKITEKSTNLSQVTITASLLNVRNAPNTNGAIIGRLRKDQVVNVDYKVDNWYSIYFGDHGGFICADYTK